MAPLQIACLFVGIRDTEGIGRFANSKGKGCCYFHPMFQGPASCLGSVSGRILPPPQICMLKSYRPPTPPRHPKLQNVTVFGARLFKEAFRLNEVLGGGLNPGLRRGD